MAFRHAFTAVTTVVLATLSVPAIAQQGVPGLHFVENWDLDRNGIVTLQELTERRGDVFYMFDQNEDGSLDDTEYTLFDETRAADMQNAGGHGRGMQPAANGLTRDFNDTDGDGLVTRAEFVEHASEWLNLMDRDGSGDITTADFGRN